MLISLHERRRDTEDPGRDPGEHGAGLDGRRRYGIYPAKTAANARRFLRDLDRAAPMRITRILTDNGKEFTDRLLGLRRRAATGIG